jgi:uncharacterized protein
MVDCWRRPSVALIVALALPVSTYAQAAAPTVAIATGQAEVGLPPNRAVLRLAITTHAATAALASSANGRKQQQVVAALTKLGYGRRHVEAAGFSVSPNVDYEHARRLIDYEAQADVTIRVDSLPQLGTVIDVALGAGGTEIRGITFQSDSTDAGRSRALTEALASARRDADTFARASGLRLGRLIEISTMTPIGGGGPLALQAGMRSGGYQTIVPEDVQITVTVYARWELTP